MQASFYIGYKSKAPYVYIWLSKSESVVYIGQTNDAHGVIGRARQHVAQGGTLRSRLYEHGYNLDLIDDFLLLSYSLPSSWEYSGEESAGRESVEYFVQMGIRQRQMEFDSMLEIVSTVRPVSFFDSKRAEELAKEIVDDFMLAYGM